MFQQKKIGNNIDKMTIKMIRCNNVDKNDFLGKDGVMLLVDKGYGISKYCLI